MTRLLSKLLVTAALLSAPARADTITIGVWDGNSGGGVVPLAGSRRSKKEPRRGLGIARALDSLSPSCADWRQRSTRDCSLLRRLSSRPRTRQPPQNERSLVRDHRARYRT